ncbi:hypothetical protein [Bombella sp. ESL0385]|uniref:hypothetical protein n=1 Tax=Bombella sp. ESL0385 TaxID=2676446 RepID=UPI0012D8E9F1|nr:hypothetical protein [Bombella sp. ESL0385]MUG89654.1 hypothetical protein [Bombella sp. ESL0385]
MKQTDTRPLFATPWAEQADSSTIATIPQSATTIGRASMALGFPKATMTPIAAGGVPPYGEDMNGILNMLSRAARTAELGMLHPFSADYAATINGYPVGATIAHPTIAGRFLICTADNNTNDPSQSMNGWLDPLGNYATAAALQQETQRAQAAEAGLLPLSGGTITGPINRAGGGVLPEVIGPNLTGRVVIQAFVATGQTGVGYGNEAWVSFPASFTPGTIPVISIAITRETGGNYVSRFAPIGVYLNTATPHINNTGFSFQPAYAKGGEVNTSGAQWTLQVIAIGVMQ